MQGYLVHIERLQQIPWEIVVNNNDGRAINMRIYNSGSQVKIDTNLHKEELVEMETWYCRNEAEAELLAKKLAVLAPGRVVLITKVIAVAQSTSNPAIVATFSEKGLIPK